MKYAYRSISSSHRSSNDRSAGVASELTGSCQYSSQAVRASAPALDGGSKRSSRSVLSSSFRPLRLSPAVPGAFFGAWPPFRGMALAGHRIDAEPLSAPNEALDTASGANEALRQAQG